MKRRSAYSPRNTHRGDYQTPINKAHREHVWRPSLMQRIRAELRTVLRQEPRENKIMPECDYSQSVGTHTGVACN